MQNQGGDDLPLFHTSQAPPAVTSSVQGLIYERDKPEHTHKKGK